MRLGKTLKIIVFAVPILVIALFVGLIAVLMNTDFNQFKPRIAAEVKKATGRDLVIAGDLSLKISFNPALTVEGVSFSNARWGSRPEMAKIGRFEGQIAILPLFAGIVEIDRLIVSEADILLEVDKAGRANFDFAEATAATPKPQPAAPAQPAAGQSNFELAIGVREVVIEKSRIAYRDAGSGASYRTAIDELVLRGDGPNDPVTLLYRGSYNDAPIKADAQLGTPAELLKPTKPWPVNLTVEAGGATLGVTGTIAEPTTAKGLNLAVAVGGKQLGDLSALAGAPVPPLGAYSLAAKLSGDPATAIMLDGLKASLAGSDVAGRIAVNLAGKRPSINAKLTSGTIDVDALATDPAAAAGGGGAGQVVEVSDRVFPDDPLPLEGLRAVDVVLTLDAGNIIASGARLRDATVAMAMAGGNLTVDPLKATLAGGTMRGLVNLDGRTDVAGLALKLDLDKVDLDPLLSDMQITQEIEGLANINVNVKGRGASVRRIMASLDGEAGLLMGKGRMKDSVLQTLLGGPGQLLGNVLDKGEKGYTVVNCAVVDFGIASGMATARSLYLDTMAKGIIGGGTVDLRTERLDLTVDPRRKKDIGKPVLPVRIRGTLMEPEYRVDEKVAVEKLTKLLGKKLPAGLLAGQDDPAMLSTGACAPPAPAAAAQPETPAASPAVPTTREEAIDRAEDEVKKRLKGLFGQ